MVYVRVSFSYTHSKVLSRFNLVTKLKKTSMRHFFYKRCAGGPKSKDFWPTIKGIRE